MAELTPSLTLPRLHLCIPGKSFYFSYSIFTTNPYSHRHGDGVNNCSTSPASVPWTPYPTPPSNPSHRPHSPLGAVAESSPFPPGRHAAAAHAAGSSAPNNAPIAQGSSARCTRQQPGTTPRKELRDQMMTVPRC